MTESRSAAIRTAIPHSARIWNYWMGGKDYYEVDRVAGDAGIAVDPEITTMAIQSRQFLIRAVRHLTAEAGVRQFLDIGTGLPTMQNTHEVAQGIAPEARIVHVDNDPLVLALLTRTGGAAYVPLPKRKIAAVFDGLEPVAPGFVSITEWRPDAAEVGRAQPISAYGAVARKP